MIVSLAIATKFRPRALARLLDSAISLKRPPDEIVVVDNGPDDETRSEAEARGVRYIAEPGGIAGVRQAGIDNSSGEVIVMTDDDCILEEGFIEAIEAAFESNPRLGLAGGRIENIGFGEEGRRKGRSILTRNFLPECPEDIAEATVFGNSNLSVRRSAIDEIGGYDPFLTLGHEESDLTLRLIERGWEMEYLEGARLRHVRSGPGHFSISPFWGRESMRMYLFLKHRFPKGIGAWARFLVDEMIVTLIVIRRMIERTKGLEFREAHPFFAGGPIRLLFARILAGAKIIVLHLIEHIPLPYIAYAAARRRGLEGRR